MGGGIGDYLAEPLIQEPQQWLSRTFFDLSFFLLITIVMLNVVFGIIIDTFSDLRGQKEEKEANKLNMCFICGHSRALFDSPDNPCPGFRHHIHADHSLWAYVDYLVHIWETGLSDRTGLEKFVHHMVATDDISWLPLGRAMVLTVGPEEEEETAMRALTSSVEDMGGAQQHLAQQVSRLSSANASLTAEVAELRGLLLRLSRHQRSATETNLPPLQDRRGSRGRRLPFR